MAGIALLAALRVAVYGAIFPPFNNIDEYAHYDLVVKYARGHDPLRGSPRFDASSARIRLLHGSPEYVRVPDPNRQPGFRLTTEAASRVVERHGPALQLRNHQIHSPPTYYALAAPWYRLGRALGLDGAYAVYWVRLLNGLVYGAVVVGAYLYARRLHPGRTELHLGVPLLVAFLPQDVFYGISADVVSPLLTTFSLLAGAEWLRRRDPSRRLALAAGLLGSLAVLAKLTNAPLLAVLLGMAALRGRRWPASASLLAVAALLPVGAWVLRNQLVLGDPTANVAKIALYGWSLRPPDRVLAHPLFTAEGAWGYLRHVFTIYWRGEVVWHGSAIRSPSADAFYAVSSLVAVGVGVVAGVVQGGRARAATLLHAAVLVGGVATLAALSVRFEYAEGGAPSRDHPFFAGARLIMGTLAPFACLYVAGIAELLHPLRRLRRGLDARATVAVVALVACLVTVDEARLHAPVVGSDYNWLALHGADRGAGERSREAGSSGKRGSATTAPDATSRSPTEMRASASPARRR